MSFSVTNIGTNVNAAGNATITVPAGGVPAGAIIFVATQDNGASNFTGSSVTDTAGNTYVNIQNGSPNGSTTNGISATWYVASATALVSGNTIVFHRVGNTSSAIVACYITGGATTSPLDTAVTAKGTGSSSSPTVTSGTPSGPGELFIGAVVGGSSSPTFNQAASWSAPPNDDAGTPRIAGGNQVNAGSGTLTYNPTFSGSGASHAWIDFIQAFKPPSAPVVENDWPQAARRMPQQQSDTYRGSPALLTPNPSRPFTQYDWPAKPPVQPQKSDVYRGSLALISPNPAQPFAQFDWPIARTTQKAKVDDFVNLPKPVVVVTVQFSELDWPLPAPPRATSQSDSYRGSLALLSPNPAQPFNQNLWENAQPRSKAIGEAIGTNNPLLTPNPSQPFSQQLWENCARTLPKSIGDVLAPPNPIIYPNPAQPFRPSDWPLPRGTQKAKVDDFVLLPTPAVILAPFFQSDWPRPTDPSRQPVRYEILPNLSASPIPPGTAIDYFFLFDSQMLAQIDTIIGPYFSTNLKNLDVLLIRDLRQSDSLAPGYRVLISKPAPLDPLLFFHPHIELVVNRTAMVAKLPSLIFSRYTDTSNIQIMINNSGATYTQRGLS